jgi:hypothetical protein
VALKVRLMNSEQDRPDLATALARRQGKFAWGLMAVQFRLFVYRRGAILWTKPAIG